MVRAAVLALVLALGTHAQQAPQDNHLHVGIDLGSEFAKVALELSEGPCRNHVAAVAEVPSGPCRGLVRRSDPIVLTAAGKVRAASPSPQRSTMFSPCARADF